MKKMFVLIISWIVISSFAFAAENTNPSIFDLNSNWVDQNGRQLKLNQLSGTKTILSMAYTRCSHSCPLTISKMSHIFGQIPKGAQSNVRLVLVSFDRKNDTPEKLKTYMLSRKLDESKWTFLTATSEGAIRELAVTLGINFKPVGDSDFSHSNVVVLLDDNGVILERLDNLSADTTKFSKTAASISK